MCVLVGHISTGVPGDSAWGSAGAAALELSIISACEGSRSQQEIRSIQEMWTLKIEKALEK